MRFPQNATHVGILALLTLACFSPYLLHWGEFPDAYDLVRHRSYLLNLIHDSTQQYGELPLWDPYTFAGYPHVANPHAQLFFPLTLLFIALPPDLLFAPLTILLVFLAGWGTYRFARALQLRPEAALLAGIAYMLSGTILAKVHNGVFTYLESICLMPLLFLAVERLRQRPDRTRLCALAVIGALLLSVNNLQLFAYAVAAAALFLLLQLAFDHWRNAWRVLRTAALSGVLALLIGAAVFLPVLDGAQYSTITRETDYAFITEGSLPPQFLSHLVLPWLFGTADTYFGPKPWGTLYNYLGVLTLLLAAIAIRYARQAPAKSLFALSGLTLLFAFGGYTPLFRIIAFVPGFDLFRFPSKMMVVFAFAVALLAGFGAQQLIDRRWTPRAVQQWQRALLMLCMLAAIALFAIFLEKSAILEKGASMLAERYAEQLRLRSLEYYLPQLEVIYRAILSNAAMVFAMLAASAFLIPRAMRQRKLHIALLVLLAGDLLFFGVPLIQTAPPDALFAGNPVAEFLSVQPGHFRVLDTARALPQDIAIRHHLQLVNGYGISHLSHYTDLTVLAGNLTPAIGPVPSVATLDLDHLAAQQALDLLNVRYVITRQPVHNPHYQLVREFDMPFRDLGITARAYLYENPSALPRAFIVPAVRTMPAEEQRAQISHIDPRQVALAESPITLPPLFSGGTFAEVPVIEYTPNRIALTTDAAQQSFLVLSEMWYPGWQAAIDGNPVPISRTNYALRGVVVPAGRHTLTFTFSPESYRIGKLLSIVGLVAWGMVWLRRRGRIVGRNA